jgi:hypothetical protein
MAVWPGAGASAFLAGEQPAINAIAKPATTVRKIAM